jgi:hypothetical protein
MQAASTTHNQLESEMTGNDRTASATLTYIAPSREPLYNYYLMEPPPGRQASNEVPDPRAVSVRNLREEHCRLDVHGFELVSFRPSVKDIYDSAQRAETFDPEVSALVKRCTGAIEARVFSPFLRGDEAQRRNPGSISAPSSFVHVDFTHESGPMCFDQILGDDADRLRGRRYAIINVWRPIAGPLQDRPLTVCDARTVGTRNLVRSKAYSRMDEQGLNSSDGKVYEAETYAVLHDPAHRWYYAPEMMPDEALLLKNYDSALTGVSRFTPHTSFVDPFAPARLVPRASIEVRVLTVW